MVEAFISVIGAGLLAVIGWAFSLHSRVAVLEADKVSLKELIEAKFDGVIIRLVRIEHILDGK